MKKQKLVKLKWPNINYFLTRHKTYSITAEEEGWYSIVDNTGTERWFSKEGFEVVEESSPQQEVEYYEVIKKVPLSGYNPGTKLHKTKSFDEYAQYPEFFKPHYKAQYKAGDWVYIIEAENGATAANNKVGVITTEDPTTGRSGPSVGYSDVGMCIKIGKEVWDIGTHYKIRKAISEEIEAASAITIAGYKLEVVKQGTGLITAAKFGCSTYDYEAVINAKTLVNSGLTLSYKGEEITIDKLNQILDKLK